MLNEDDLRPGDVIQDAMGDFWHVHDDGKTWCSEPGARISFETANGKYGPFTYAPGCDPKRDAPNASGDGSVKDEGKWTRADLPELPEADGSWISQTIVGLLGEWFDHIADHLNKHYPKQSDNLYSMVLSQAGHVHDLKADLADMTRERDAAVARAERAEQGAWRIRFQQAVADLLDAKRGRDEWKDRAEKVEQLIPAYAMLDAWGALGRDSIHFDDWYDEHGYAEAWAELTAAVREGRSDLDAARENAEHYQAMFDATELERDEWKARAEAAERSRGWFRDRAESAEARTAPAVSRADIEKALAPYDLPLTSVEDAVEALHRLVSGDDLVVHVVREGNVEAQSALRNRFGEFVINGTVLNVTTAEDCREKAQRHLDAVARCESIARAIEAEQAVDPVEDKAIELHQVAYGGRIGFGHATLNAQEMFRSLARHVLGQEGRDE